MSEAEELAKAIQESAKLGGKGIESAEKLGGFLSKVFKEPTAEISGIITDKLRFVRWKRLVAMSDEVNKILEDKGVSETKAVPPRIALPIFEDSSLEDDPNIQSLWNHLLANAMDPNFNSEVRYGFIDMIKNITAIEAGLLNTFYDILKEQDKLEPLDAVHESSLKKEHIIQILNLTRDQYALAANNLMRMQLVGPAIIPGVGSLGRETTFYKGILRHSYPA